MFWKRQLTIAGNFIIFLLFNGILRPIKLTVAKSFDNSRSNYFSVPPKEPVRPIDTQAWVQHTNAVRGVLGMHSIPEGKLKFLTLTCY